MSAAADTLGIFLNRWRDGLAPSGRGVYLGDERNILIALREAPELAGLLRVQAQLESILRQEQEAMCRGQPRRR